MTETLMLTQYEKTSQPHGNGVRTLSYLELVTVSRF